MLNDGPSEGIGMGTMKQVERCRPDYEGMIARLKEKRGRSAKFRDAALEYYDGRKANGKMAELIGELVTEVRKLDTQIAATIEQQEKDPEK